MVSLVIDDRPVSVQDGTSLLDAARAAGADVPTLCSDERLKPSGACRMCMVQIEGGREVAACTTPVAKGMRVQTATPQIESQRRTILSLLAETHPVEPPPGPVTPFHALLARYGIAPQGHPRRSKTLHDDTHPYLLVDMDRCIDCFRCVRICDEVQGQFVWRVWNRADRTEIRLDQGATLLESTCVSCGACADTCPTGAITDRVAVRRDVPVTWTRTTCPYCGTGCEMDVAVQNQRIAQIRPRLDAPVNKGHLCVKGRYAHQFVHASDRVLSPMIRTATGWKDVGWDEAFDTIAERLAGILKESGPDSVGVLGSSRATNEENYLAQKFARVVLGSNNVDCCARVCHGPTAVAMNAMLGTGAATNSFDDIERAKGFLISGLNPTENHPIVGARIKQAVLAGARLVVVDPREIELARFADVHLAIRAGTNVPVLNALAHTIVEEGLFDEEYARDRTEGLEEYTEFLKAYTPESVAKIAGVDAGRIREAARVYAGAKPAMVFHGLGMTEHTQGTEGVECLVNLALLTGNIGKVGGGENPLRGQNNVQGSAHMGCEPSRLAGYSPIATSAELFEGIWGRPVPRQKGMNWMEMLDATHDGRLRALLAIGYDVYFTNPDADRTAEGLRQLDLMIVQDLFLNETAREFAHVFLPACSSFEKDGTFMNSERRVQRVRKCLEPIGETRSDWEIVCGLAARMGFAKEFAYRDAEEIWDEVRKGWKPGAGISYDRIEDVGLQWPCPSEDHPGTTLLHAKQFSIGERARFRLIEYIPTSETVSAEFPFLLITGRTLYQFNAGTMTERTGNPALRPTDTLDLAPRDAEQLGIATGDPLRVTSKYGGASLPARVDPSLTPGQVFATFHDPKVFLNRLTSPLRDRRVGTPEYKVTAVRVERL